ncbi:MAG: hypothetical protein U0Y82_16290 [Thermoleophilia bacterium]
MRDITDHDEMLRRLGVLMTRTDPVPPQVTLAARAAIAWHRMDAEIAELLFDSAAEEALAGTRGVTGGVRQLTFEAPSGACVEMEVLPGIEAVRAAGAGAPPGAARVFVAAHRRRGGRHGRRPRAVPGGGCGPRPRQPCAARCPMGPCSRPAGPTCRNRWIRPREDAATRGVARRGDGGRPRPRARSDRVGGDACGHRGRGAHG